MGTMSKTKSICMLAAMAAFAALCACALSMATAHQAYALNEGDVFKVDGNTYKVIDVESDESNELDDVSLVKYGSSDKTPVIDTVKYKGETYEVDTIGKGAFNNKKGHKITSIKLGRQVDNIRAKAFYGCKKLKRINMRKCGVIDIVTQNGMYKVDDIDIGAKAFAKAGTKSIKVKCGSSNEDFQDLIKDVLMDKGMRSSVTVVK